MSYWVMIFTTKPFITKVCHNSFWVEFWISKILTYSKQYHHRCAEFVFFGAPQKVLQNAKKFGTSILWILS